MDELLDASYAPKYVEQGSENWELLRVGRFTSSEIHKIMECGWRPMTPEELAARPKTGIGSKTTRVPDPSKMSDRGMKYIYAKVAEILTGRPKPSSSYAYPIVWGKETEAEAVEFFEKKYSIQCEQVGFQPWGDHAGGSPDRLIDEHSGLEVKCPFLPENQIEYLMLTDIWDLKAVHPEYYWQVVSLMLFTGRKHWYFCTYDPRMIDDKHKLTTIEFNWYKIEADVDLLIKALEGAIKEKLKLISQI